MEPDLLDLDIQLSPDFHVADFFAYINEADLLGLIEHCNDNNLYISLAALSNAVLQPILTSLAPNKSIRILKGICDPITAFFCDPMDEEKSWQHYFCQAVDIVFEKEAMRSLPEFLENSHIIFDQCYLEHIDEAGYPEKIHISYKKEGGNRCEVIFTHHE